MRRKRKTDDEIERWCVFQNGWDCAQMGMEKDEALYCSKARPADCPDCSSEFMDGYVRYFDYHRRALTLTEWDQRRHGHDLWRVLDPQIPTPPGEEGLLTATQEADRERAA